MTGQGGTGTGPGDSDGPSGPLELHAAAAPLIPKSESGFRLHFEVKGVPGPAI